MPKKNLTEGSIKGGMKKPEPSGPRPPAPRGQETRVSNKFAESKTRGNMKNDETTTARPPEPPRGQALEPPTAVTESVAKLVELIGRAGLAVASERLAEVEFKVTVKPIPGKHGEVEIAIDAPPELMKARKRK